jgi:hypothetical protein
LDIQAIDSPAIPIIHRKQLEILHRFAEHSRMSHKPFWLAGGWAVEALTGEEAPRLHGDIDLLIFRADYSAFHSYLARNHHVFLGEQYHGFSAVKYTGGNPMLLSLVFLDWEEGRLVTYLPDDTVNWPCEDPYKLPVERLGGKPFPVCDWEMAYAYSELAKHLDPDQRESPDEGIYAEQVKAARRKAISKELIVPYEQG